MTQLMSDPYATLGVARGASPQQVRQAYRRLAKRYHPDLHPQATTTERMGRINQAWQVLSSPARRARYDLDNPQHGSSGAGHWSAPPRRPSAAASAHRTQGTAWASTGSTRAYPRATAWADPSSPSYMRRNAPPWPEQRDDEGPRWPAVLLTVVGVWVVIAATFVGILPFPLFGLVLLFLASRFFGRYD